MENSDHLIDKETGKEFSFKGITKSREEKLYRTVANRQQGLVVLLENVTDPHNLGAVLRTCDSVGVSDVYVLFTKITIPKEDIEIGSKSASGAKRWIRVHYYDDLDLCIKDIKSRVPILLGTHLGHSAQSIYDVDLTQPFALVMGNELTGITEELLERLDGNLYIPQMGMVQSLNISVAAAVILYESLRQRKLAGKYQLEGPPFELSPHQSGLMEHYTNLCHVGQKEFIVVKYIEE